MPALPSVPNVLRLNFVHTYGPINNVEFRLFFKYAGGTPSGADLNTLCSSAATSWNTHLAPDVGGDTTLTSVNGIDLASSTGASGSATVSHTGTDAGPVLTASTAVLINFKIARRYRGGKPRVYVPAFTQAELANPDSWISASASSFNGRFSSFIGDIVATTGMGVTISNQVNVSYYHGFTVVTNPTTGRSRNVPTLRTGGPVVDNVTGNTTSIKPGTQRRRLGR